MNDDGCLILCNEGIAVGCAMYGLQRVREREQFEKKTSSSKSSKVINLSDNNTAGTTADTTSDAVDGQPPDVIDFQQSPFSAYQGKEFDTDELEDILVDWLPWITHTKHTSQQSLINAAVDRIAKGEVVAWFQGKSEFGQRALGSRSILADPR